MCFDLYFKTLAASCRVSGSGGRRAGVASVTSARSHGGVAPNAVGVGVDPFLDIFGGKPTQFADE